MLQPLAGHQTDAAGRRVPQHRVAGLHRIGAPHQVLDRHALEHHRRRRLVVDGVGQFHDPVGGDQAFFRIGAQRRGRVGDAVADLEIADTGADGDDDACCLHADHQRRLDRIKAGAVVDVDVVEADGALLQAHLALAGIADLDVDIFQDFGSAGLFDADGFYHALLVPFPLSRLLGVSPGFP